MYDSGAKMLGPVAGVFRCGTRVRLLSKVGSFLCECERGEWGEGI